MIVNNFDELAPYFKLLKNKEDFYSKFGFEPRPSQWRGAGMFKFLRNE